MKKIYLSVVTILIMISLLLPVQSLAASNAEIKVGNQKLRVGDIVEVTVKTSSATGSIQFDLDFDNTKFDYVNGSASTNNKLNMTSSSKIDDDTVRVSAVSTEGKTTDNVTLKFKAIATGNNSNFKVVDGKIEIADGVGKLSIDTLTNPVAKVVKIDEAKKNDNGNNGNGGGSSFVDSNGRAITELPKTGVVVKTSELKSVGGIYETLITGKKTIAYVLPNCDSVLKIEDIKEEFEVNGKTINQTNIGNVVKTGDSFQYNGDDTLTDYTIVIYGDINCDGKVTTYDIYYAVKEGNNLSDVAKVAAKVDENNSYEGIQQFILNRRLQVSGTNTILDKMPVEFYGMNVVNEEDVEFHRYEKNVIATLTADNKSIAINDDMLKNNDSIYLSYEITNKPEEDTGAICELERVNDGKYNVILKNASVIDEDYTIKITITGKKVAGSKIEKNVTVKVKEDTSVNDIDLVLGEENLGKSITIPMNTKLEPKVLYYHKYVNGPRVPLSLDVVTKDIEIEQIKATESEEQGKLSNYEKLSENKSLIENDEAVLSYVQIATKKLTPSLTAKKGDTILKFTIKNDPSDSGKDVTINVKITVEDKADTILLNSNRIENIKNINLYKNVSDSVGSDDIVCDIGGNIYTIFKIDLLYKNNGLNGFVYGKDIYVQTKDKPKYSAGNRKIEFYDGNESSQISVIPVNKIGNEFKKANDTSVPIEYIGIAFIGIDTSKVSNIKIWYDTLDDNEVVTKLPGVVIPVTHVDKSQVQQEDQGQAMPLMMIRETSDDEKSAENKVITEDINNTNQNDDNAIGNKVIDENIDKSVIGDNKETELKVDDSNVKQNESAAFEGTGEPKEPVDVVGSANLEESKTEDVEVKPEEGTAEITE